MQEVLPACLFVMYIKLLFTRSCQHVNDNVQNAGTTSCILTHTCRNCFLHCLFQYINSHVPSWNVRMTSSYHFLLARLSIGGLSGIVRAIQEGVGVGLGWSDMVGCCFVSLLRSVCICVTVFHCFVMLVFPISTNASDQSPKQVRGCCWNGVWPLARLVIWPFV